MRREAFSTRERSALAWAETVTRVAETGIPDADYEAAAAEFGDKELADLTYAIGLMNAFNRFGIRSVSTAAGKLNPLAASSHNLAAQGLHELQRTDLSQWHG